MKHQSNPDERFGVKRDGSLMTKEELLQECPSPQEMIEEMGIGTGDVFRDKVEDMEYIVSNVNSFGSEGEILLDDTGTDSPEDNFEGGITTGLISYYAKWRRGQLTIIESSSMGSTDSNDTHSVLSPVDGSIPYEETDDIYEEKAMMIVEELIERGIFHLDDSNPRLYHEPSGRIFASVVNATHFHVGWEAAAKN